MSEIKNKKPRLCEILGVEVREEFGLNAIGGMATYYICEEGIMRYKQNGTYARPEIICHVINHPEEIIHMPSLTEQEMAVCRAIGAKWVTRNWSDNNHKFVNLWAMKPVSEYGIYTSCGSGMLLASFYDECGLFVRSVKPGGCIRVEETVEAGEK